MGKSTDIREALEAGLGEEPLVDTTDITAKNIAGDVALDGTVANYSQYLEAAKATWRVAG